MASPFLGAYLHLESEMMSLDRRSDPAAERLRDFMDPLWHALDGEDREYLNNRKSESLGVLGTLEVSSGYFLGPSPGSDELTDARIGRVFSDGELAFSLDSVLAA